MRSIRSICDVSEFTTLLYSNFRKSEVVSQRRYLMDDVVA